MNCISGSLFFKTYYFNISILTFSNHKNLGARILNYLQDVREFYHALGVGGLEEYIYNVRVPEPYWWVPKDSIRYSAPVVGPLKGPIYNSGTKLGSQNRRTAEAQNR